MAEVFYVQCPQCGGRHPCHTEDLWNSGYDLLCPYCGHEFSQEEGLEGMKGAPVGTGARPPIRPPIRPPVGQA